MAWWRRYLNWRLRNVSVVRADDDGVTVIARGAATKINWADIDRIVAYKRDIMITDLLCLAIESPDTMLEIHEQMEGYAAAEAALTERLALDVEWPLRVLFPAFETNAETIFQREANPG